MAEVFRGERNETRSQAADIARYKRMEADRQASSKQASEWRCALWPSSARRLLAVCVEKLGSLRSRDAKGLLRPVATACFAAAAAASVEKSADRGTSFGGPSSRDLFSPAMEAGKRAAEWLVDSLPRELAHIFFT